MKIFVCLDDENGMMFNGRRQSRDSKVVEDILRTSGGEKLLMNGYSGKLFEGMGMGSGLHISGTFLEEAAEDASCFVENVPLAPYEDRISRITVYRWNRKYPHDMELDIDLAGWELKERTELKGSSHEAITKEVYCR